MHSFQIAVDDPHRRPTPDDYVELRTEQTNDRNVRIVDGALVLKNIQKSHEGYYLCKASNGIGGISAVARISVQGEFALNMMRWLTLTICTFLFLHHSPSLLRNKEAKADHPDWGQHRPGVPGQGRETHRGSVEHEQQTAGR